MRNFAIVSLVCVSTLLAACGGGMKMGAGLKVDAKGGIKGGAEFKTSVKKEVSAGTDSKKGEDSSVSDALDGALSGGHRAEANRSRDSARHPKETLEFFGLRADMSVLEVEPGSDAFFVEILAPVLRDKGKLTVTTYDMKGPEKSLLTQEALALDAKLKSSDLYAKVDTVVIEGRTDYKLGEPGSYDLIITFRNLHLWKTDRNEGRVYKAIFEALKPGGVFGIEQHRACAGAKADRTARDGYLPQAYVIETVEKAGFVFEEESSINANWKDTRDYPRGVWSLPPVLAMGNKDRERMMAIGESDRMTLRFRKPLETETPSEKPADGAGAAASAAKVDVKAEVPKTPTIDAKASGGLKMGTEAKTPAAEPKAPAAAPKTEAPKTEAPKTEAPKAVAPKTDATKSKVSVGTP